MKIHWSPGSTWPLSRQIYSSCLIKFSYLLRIARVMGGFSTCSVRYFTEFSDKPSINHQVLLWGGGIRNKNKCWIWFVSHKSCVLPERRLHTHKHQITQLCDNCVMTTIIHCCGCSKPFTTQCQCYHIPHICLILYEIMCKMSSIKCLL